MIKKLITKDEREKKQKRNQIILGVILAVVMIISTLGFAIQSNFGNSEQNQDSSLKVKYNSYEFENRNGLWSLGTSDGTFVFSYNPKQTFAPEIFSLNIKAENYRGKPAYIFSEDEDAKIELYVNMLNIAERVQEACIQGEKCKDEKLPIKSCSDNIIIIKESNSSSIRQDGSCVFIEGKQNQLVSLVDEFLFKILEIK